MFYRVEDKPLVVLTGPTAVGKTALSIKLAKALNGEIISADSMQVYRGMDIGSAKVTREEMEGVPHHLMDVLDPADAFNVVTFQSMARAAIEEIYSRGRIPILAGGTGFYIQAVLNDIDFTREAGGSELRTRLEAEAELLGSQVLYERLMQVDPEGARAIHPNNVKRVIRALEYYAETGQKISDHNEEQRQKESPYRFAYFVLTMDRAKLYRRIEKRIDLMLNQGLVDEVKRLRAAGCHRGMVSMQGLGYKEILDYLEGSCSFDEAVYTLKRDTRHFAKRQLTWFRREREVCMIDKDQFAGDDDRILAYMLDVLKKKGVLIEE